MKVLTGTKSVIEALSIPEGFVAYATDTNELGTYDGAGWAWSNRYVLVAGDTVTGGLVTESFRTLAIAEIGSGDSPYTAGNDDIITVDASGGAVTINLPAVVAGRRYQIKCIDSTNTVTIDADGSETIDGIEAMTLVQYDSLVLIAGSSEWHIM